MKEHMSKTSFVIYSLFIHNFLCISLLIALAASYKQLDQLGNYRCSTFLGTFTALHKMSGYATREHEVSGLNI